MMMRRIFSASVLVALVLILANSCKHEPWVPSNFNPSPDDTTTTSASCDPDTVYFVNDVLPIFASSCAMSGCHNAVNPQDGVNLSDYFHIMSTGDVDPGDPNGSKVYEVLFETGNDMMPPSSSGITLTADQREAIYTWILQGAANNACEEALCDTVNVSYASDIRPIMDLHCLGCHSYPASSGAGIALDSYASLSSYASSGALLGAIAHQTGYTAMPLGTAMLPDCKIATIRNWITEGTLDN